MRKFLVSVAALTAIGGIITAAHAAASINGRWTTKEKDAVVEISAQQIFENPAQRR
jgi:hypothetical protein